MIYVDDMHAPFMRGNHKMFMSHLFSDTSIAELEEFAEKLALKPAWLQNSNGFIHYDVSASKRTQALELGAIPIKYRDLPKYVKRNLT